MIGLFELLFFQKAFINESNLIQSKLTKYPQAYISAIGLIGAPKNLLKNRAALIMREEADDVFGRIDFKKFFTEVFVLDGFSKGGEDL